MHNLEPFFNIKFKLFFGVAFQFNMIEDIRSNHTLKIKIKWSVKRKTKSSDVKEICEEEKEIGVEAYVGNTLHV